MSNIFPLLLCFSLCRRWKTKWNKAIAWKLQKTVLQVFTPWWGFAGSRNLGKDPDFTSWGRNWTERWKNSARALGQSLKIRPDLDPELLPCSLGYKYKLLDRWVLEPQEFYWEKRPWTLIMNVCDAKWLEPWLHQTSPFGSRWPTQPDKLWNKPWNAWLLSRQLLDRLQ